MEEEDFNLEPALKSMLERMNERFESYGASSFLLGLDMGVTSKRNSRDEAFEWIKRNFSNKTWFIETIERELAKEKKCSVCETPYDTGSKFCNNFYKCCLASFSRNYGKIT